jgi:tryptophan synthase alpha chain
MNADRCGAAAVERALRAPKRPGQPALVAFLTGGFPDLDRFAALLVETAAAADLVEVGIPFRDPMADGVSIQRSSHAALNRGASLRRILDRIAGLDLAAPVLLMSYLNPLLAFGFDRLAAACVAARVAGLVVPDLPFDEDGALRAATAARGLAQVCLVTPLTPADRLLRSCEASSGFVYAVTVAGTTGAAIDADAAATYLDRVRTFASLPVCAGFGIRGADDVARLRDHADGLIVGTALVEAIERGQSPTTFLDSLFTSR